MLRAYKNLSDNNRSTADFSLTLIPYSRITSVLYRQKEDATLFFKRYLDNERGVSLIEHNFNKFDFTVKPESSNSKTEKSDSNDDKVEPSCGSSPDYFIVTECQGCHKV